jgi:hypothetical protein
MLDTLMLPPSLPFSEELVGEESSSSDEELDTALSEKKERQFIRSLQLMEDTQESIGKVMFHCILYSRSAERILDLIFSAILSPQINVPKRVMRFHLLHDVLFNSQCAFPNAWKYKIGVESRLLDLFESLNQIYLAIPGRLSQEQFRISICNCVHMWKSWDIFDSDLMEEIKVVLVRRPIKPDPSIVHQDKPTKDTQINIKTSEVNVREEIESKFKPLPIETISLDTVLQKPKAGFKMGPKMKQTRTLDELTDESNKKFKPEANSTDRVPLHASTKPTTRITKAKPIQIQLSLKSNQSRFIGEPQAPQKPDVLSPMYSGGQVPQIQPLQPNLAVPEARITTIHAMKHQDEQDDLNEILNCNLDAPLVPFDPEVDGEPLSSEDDRSHDFIHDGTGQEETDSYVSTPSIPVDDQSVVSTPPPDEDTRGERTVASPKVETSCIDDTMQLRSKSPKNHDPELESDFDMFA